LSALRTNQELLGLETFKDPPWLDDLAFESFS
jgi:hypothetical protein